MAAFTRNCPYLKEKKMMTFMYDIKYNSGMKKIFFLLLAFCCGMANAQTVADDLPKTWRLELPNSVIETTLHEDGRLTSQTVFRCFTCSGMGMCGACHGTGGQYWYGIGIQPCGSCFGTGRCRGCEGKGVNIQNSTTQYGATVVYDECGNMYVMSGPGDSSSSRHSVNTRNKTEVIEYLPTYGVSGNENVYCSKCRKTMSRHVHVLK